MLREIHTRWKISGILTAQTPIHIGGMGGDADTDLALAVNGRGKYYIPGTSLAGAFRSWMGGLLKDEEKLKDIWGDHENEKRGASFIIVDDAEINLNKMTIEIREGVGIDRHTGAAAENPKYSRAILPKGVTFPLDITLDIGKEGKQKPDDLWQLLRALEEGDIRIGAAKTRGLGKIQLSCLAIHEQIFDTQNIFDVLLKGGKCHLWEDLKPKQYEPPDKLTLEIAWTPKDPVMVKREGDGIAVDILPLVSQITGKIHFVIPGSSIKGVLRSHAERIVRTVCQKPTKDDFLEQVQLDLVNEIFGKAEKSEQKSQTSQGKIGALSIDDCYATIAMEATKWSDVENTAKSDKEEFGGFKEALKTAILPNNSTDNPFQKLQPAMHVAIDRWTGGAAEGMLYTVLEPIGVNWHNIGIYLDLERLKKYDPGNEKAAIALILLVIRDFADRKIPIGYGTNRGMGTVEVKTMTINGLDGVDDGSTISPDLSTLGNDVLTKLNKAWNNWIDNNQSKKEAS